MYALHSVKSVRIRSIFGLYFSPFGLNTEIYYVNLWIYSVNLCIQFKIGKIRGIKSPNTDIFTHCLPQSFHWVVGTYLNFLLLGKAHIREKYLFQGALIKKCMISEGDSILFVMILLDVFYILLLFYGSLHLIYVTRATFLGNSKIWTYIYKS